ncbi:MAG: hypothetical protein GY752_08915 [bacterium]|nr:hypothetical protein [bacterium]
MYGDDIKLGSEELSKEEFELADMQNNEVLTEFHKAIEQRDGAKEFLGTPFGVALRKTLVSEKLKAMKACAETVGEPENVMYKLQYEVIKGVEHIFGLIITDGEEALRQLQVTIGDEYE